MSLPDLESLRCFVAAARHRSFRRAAREVALSPAAFSDRIKRLEDSMGERLFVRTTRSCELSIAGERALPHAREALAAAQRCREAFSASPLPFDLVLGTRYELGLSWLVPQLGPLETARPDRRLHLTFGDTKALFDALETGDIDALITSARFSKSGVDVVVLHEERYALVASPQCLEAPLRGPRDAPAHTLLDLSPERPLWRYFLDGRPAGETWNFEAVTRLGTIAAVRAELLHGRGIAVLPRYFCKRDLASGRLVEPLPRAKLSVDHFRLVFRTDHPRRLELAELGKALRSVPLR